MNTSNSNERAHGNRHKLKLGQGSKRVGGRPLFMHNCASKAYLHNSINLGSHGHIWQTRLPLRQRWHSFPSSSLKFSRHRSDSIFPRVGGTTLLYFYLYGIPMHQKYNMGINMALILFSVTCSLATRLRTTCHINCRYGMPQARCNPNMGSRMARCWWELLS
jgi:hypothetical protein